MNGESPNRTIKDLFKSLISPNYILSYLKLMRKIDYYKNKSSIISRLLLVIYQAKYKKLGIKLGFSISPSVFGYGLVIPHHGTIVVGAGNRIGNYSVIHTSTCVTHGSKIIGNAFYLSTGAIVTHDIIVGNNISVGANSLLNKSFEHDGFLIAGTPSVKIKESLPWYERDGDKYYKRVLLCEELRKQLH